MIKLWQFLWHGCWHQWSLMGSGDLVNDANLTIGQYNVYICKKCSRIEKRKSI